MDSDRTTLLGEAGRPTDLPPSVAEMPGERAAPAEGRGPTAAHPQPHRVVHASDARRRFGPAPVDRLLFALHRTDPLADDLVRRMRQRPGSDRTELVDRALAEGVDRVPDAPPELSRLFEQVERVPPWLDWDRVARAHRTFYRAGLAGGIVLGAKSLALGYCAPAGNKPLAFSGRLTQAVPRRLAETARYVSATCSPGGLRRDGDGFAIGLKVRLIHAEVRRMLERSGQWDRRAWGAPINQHDMAATILLFSLSFLDGVRELGLRVRRAEADDYIHLWRYAGFIMGVEEPLLPRDEPHARQMADIIERTQGPPDDDSRALVRALVESPRAAAQSDRDRRRAEPRVKLGYGLCRTLLGAERADQLGLPRTRWQHVVPAVRQGVAVGGALSDRWPPLGRWVEAKAEALGRRYWERAVQEGLGSVPATFALPLRLQGLDATKRPALG